MYIYNIYNIYILCSYSCMYEYLCAHTHMFQTSIDWTKQKTMANMGLDQNCGQKKDGASELQIGDARSLNGH